MAGAEYNNPEGILPDEQNSEILSTNPDPLGNSWCCVVPVLTKNELDGERESQSG